MRTRGTAWCAREAGLTTEPMGWSVGGQLRAGACWHELASHVSQFAGTDRQLLLEGGEFANHTEVSRTRSGIAHLHRKKPAHPAALVRWYIINDASVPDVFLLSGQQSFRQRHKQPVFTGNSRKLYSPRAWLVQACRWLREQWLWTKQSGLHLRNNNRVGDRLVAR